MPELGLSSTYDYSTATSNRKKSIFLVIGVSAVAWGVARHHVLRVRVEMLHLYHLSIGGRCF